MSTNLLIGYPQITVDSTITASPSYSSEFPATNICYGSRSDIGQMVSAYYESTIKFDAGSSSARTIDFFFIGNAKIAKTQGSKRAGLTASVDDVSYSNVAMNAAGFQSVTLYGPDSADLIYTAELPGYLTGSLPSSSSYRYYKAHLAGSGTCPSKKYASSQIMFGQWFDFGRDPEWGNVGSVSYENARRPALLFSFVWRGITPTVKNSAEDYLFTRRERGLILYTKDYHAPLLDYRVVQCFIKTYTVDPITDGTWSISITFEEQL